MRKIMLSLGIALSAASVIYLTGADHIDAPAVGSLTTGSTVTDITDYFAFESPANSDNYVFACTVAALTAPSATGALSFATNVMYEINIDNDGDNVEDLVIQTIFTADGSVISYGPVAPTATGLNSVIETTGVTVETGITAYGEAPQIGNSEGIKLFAGPRDDPFFFDFFKFVSIVNGVGASLSDQTNTGVYDPNRDSDMEMDGIQPFPAAFDDQGTDAFAGTNVLAVVIEVPKTMLGSSSTFSSWVESKVIVE
ncbi:MAG: DUF4331 family protein [Cyclobacteriaceae bacterium]